MENHNIFPLYYRFSHLTHTPFYSVITRPQFKLLNISGFFFKQKDQILVPLYMGFFFSSVRKCPFIVLSCGTMSGSTFNSKVYV